MKNKSKIKLVFYSLVVIFVLLMGFFVMSNALDLMREFFPLVAVLALSFLAFGIALVALSRKESGKLKIFLMMTGISAILPFLFSILHNFFYALAEIFVSLEILFELLHVVSFFISLLLAPILFIVGVLGSIILFKRIN